MGFSADMLPVVGELPGRLGLWVCGGYSGVGNVPGFAYGRLLCRVASPEPPTPRCRRVPWTVVRRFPT